MGVTQYQREEETKVTVALIEWLPQTWFRPAAPRRIRQELHANRHAYEASPDDTGKL